MGKREDLATLLQREGEAVRAVLAMGGDVPGSIFQGFPHGCCGPAAELLARHLQEHFGLAAMYAAGLQQRDGHSWSHAWVLVDGVILDITADQFEEVGAPVLVVRVDDSPWHAGWVRDDLPRSPATMCDQWPAYPDKAWIAISDDLLLRSGSSTPVAVLI